LGKHAFNAYSILLQLFLFFGFLSLPDLHQGPVLLTWSNAEMKLSRIKELLQLCTKAKSLKTRQVAVLRLMAEGTFEGDDITLNFFYDFYTLPWS
jgi:ferritin